LAICLISQAANSNDDILRKSIHNHPGRNSFSSDRDVSLIRLRFTAGNGSSDECVLHFFEEATSNYDWMYDALKMESLVPTAAECALISADNYGLSIDSRPLPSETQYVDVMADMPVMSDYTLQVIEAEGLPEGFCLVIQDIFTGDEIPVVTGESLVLSETGPFSGIRFQLRMNKVVEQTILQPLCNSDAGGEIQYVCEGNGWVATLYHNGQQMQQLTEDIASFSDLLAGEYLILYTSSDPNCSAVQMLASIINPQPMEVIMTEYSPDHCNQSADGFAYVQITNTDEYNFELISGEGMNILQGSGLTGDLLLEALDADIYNLVIDGLCGMQNLTIDLRDPMAVEAEIEPGDITLVVAPPTTGNLVAYADVANSSVYNWFLDGVLVGVNQELVLSFDEPGQYELTLHAANEECAASDTVSVEVNPVTSLDEYVKDMPFSIAMSKESLTITMLQDGGETTFSLLDIQGKEIWRMRVPTHKGKTIEAYFAGLPAGQYVLSGHESGRLVFCEKWILR
jgi:hypothetical protein